MTVSKTHWGRVFQSRLQNYERSRDPPSRWPSRRWRADRRSTIRDPHAQLNVGDGVRAVPEATIRRESFGWSLSFEDNGAFRIRNGRVEPLGQQHLASQVEESQRWWKFLRGAADEPEGSAHSMRRG